MSGTIAPVATPVDSTVSFDGLRLTRPPAATNRVHQAPSPPDIPAGSSGGTSAWRRWMYVAICVTGFMVLTAQLGFTAAFSGRMLPGVSVAGQSLTGLTRTEAKTKLAERIDGYKVSFSINDKPYTYTPEQVGVQYDLNTTLDQAYLVGRTSSLAPLQLRAANQDGALNYSYRVDAETQKKVVARVVAGQGQEPVDAAIVIINGKPTVQAEKSGQSVAVGDVEAAINRHIAAVSNVATNLQPTVQKARISSVDIAAAVVATNQLLTTPVTITYQGKVFKPTASQMGEWIMYDKTALDASPGLIPKINPDGVNHYLQTIAKAVNVDPVNRKIRVENGDSTEEQAGRDGIQLDQVSLGEQISKAVESKRALAVEAPTKPVPFQTQYNRHVSLDYGKYIEVNLSQQHLWVYQNHNVIYESPITSGATGAGFPTAQGLFSIQAKQTNRNLNGYAIGYNYNVFVKYWMPFFGDYGLHDASWRGVFGGQDYYYGGSHGCVNLPDATAAFLYGWADVGTPVWVHS